MKPLEILSLIEEAAGISHYKAKKDDTKKTIDKKDFKLSEIDNLLENDIKPQMV